MKLDFWVKSMSLVVLTASLIPLVPRPGLTATFQPPSENRAPSQATGGASRGEFIPPTDNRAPSTATGGASRADFVLPADNTAPSTATGGASRADFVLPADNAAPSQASGGASRADFVLPANQPTPVQAVGGSSRANTYGAIPAYASSRSMMAVLPESFYGTTLQARPTFMAYLPESGVQEATFSLKDEAGNLVYRSTVPVSGESGIVTIAMPAEAPALEVGENYQWFVTLNLEGALTPSSPFVDGWIKRMEPPAALAEVLQGDDVLATAEALAENGVWYDSAALFAQLYSNQPTNAEYSRHWEEFLDSVSLDELVEEPIEIASLVN